ncbi:hypothetical protein [Paracoccus simplex]|uniref:Uncharacterized protein n=1 Tax=Paracoccus simplex TaxID=2086346 RepID=A0ABV7S2I9_9RHOB
MAEPSGALDVSKAISAATKSIIDKAWEISWATRIIFIALFLDIFLLTCGCGGLLSWVQGDRPNINIASVVVFGASLCFIAAYVLPAVVFTAKAIFLALPLPLRSSERINNHPDYVLDQHVLKRAIENDNKFLLDWYLGNKEQEKSREAKLRDLSDLLFGFMIIAASNFLSHWLFDFPTILYEVVIRFGIWGEAVLFATGFFTLLFVFRVWSSFHYPYIYHPPIARSLEEERKKLPRYRARMNFKD